MMDNMKSQTVSLDFLDPSKKKLKFNNTFLRIIKVAHDEVRVAVSSIEYNDEG